MRVVIIGGGGYIGFHIGVEMKQRGHDVTLFDLFPPHSEWVGLRENMLPFVKGTILSVGDIEDVLIKTKAEAVIHTGK